MKELDFRPFINSLYNKRFNSEDASWIITGFEDDDKPLLNCLDPFLTDWAKLMECKAMRRLFDKAQVFCLPKNPHTRTRKAHTDEVATLARKMGQILGLNSELCLSAASGHDIGHTPFGHLGERAIKRLTGVNFRHEIFSVMLARFIERKGLGLNLTQQTLQGILHHSSGEGEVVLGPGLTQESRVVKLADKIAYLFADMNDAIRFNFKLPEEAFILGDNQRERVLTCAYELVKESSERGFVSFEHSEVAKLFAGLRKWMYENVYRHIDNELLQSHLEIAFEFVNTESLFEGCDPIILFACLTDREVDSIVEKSFVSQANIELGIMEMAPYLRGLRYSDLAARL